MYVELIICIHNQIHAPKIFELLNMRAGEPNHGDSSLSAAKSKILAYLQTQIPALRCTVHGLVCNYAYLGKLIPFSNRITSVK